MIELLAFDIAGTAVDEGGTLDRGQGATDHDQ